jgi:2-iminobutanoate/2-iminopropanoate deaminase
MVSVGNIALRETESYNRKFVRSGESMADTIATKNAPQAIGPYSQAIRSGGFVYTSGQIAIDPATGNVIEGDVAAQTERVLLNLAAVLTAAGSSLNKVVKTTVFLKSMGDFVTMNEIYGKHFGAHRPARSTVEVARLPKDVLVEIDVIAEA